MLNPESRTYKSLLNSVVALSFYAVNFVLSFISRRILLMQLGPDILGLNTTNGSLLSFLNLAELGIGTAVAFTLYKPLREKDTETINEIVSLQGWFYRRVASFIIGASILLLCFSPRIFAKTGLPLWYAIASYSVLLFGSLLGYFVNYRQIVLSASQQQFKLHFTNGTVSIIKVIVQLILVSIFEQNKFLWWLLAEVFFAIVSALVLNWMIKRSFPDLDTNVAEGGMLRKKYPTMLTKVKQLFVHKIGAVALNQTSPIIIYAYASLSMVTSYGNYLIITRGISTLLNAMFNSMNAGVGNLIAEGNDRKVMSVFKELFSSRFLIVSTCCFCLYYLSSSFISLWLGKEFILDQTVVLLIVVLFFISTSREVVDSFINGYGLFQDIWAPAVEAALNIGCSILFGRFWGLVGILSGVLLSQVVIILMWKPILLFRKGFRKPIGGYIIMYVKHFILLGISAWIVTKVMGLVPLEPSGSYLSFVIVGTLMAILSLAVLSGLLYCFEPGMRDFLKRILSIIHS